MTRPIDLELGSLERRLNAVCMTESEREAALAAMRNGYVIVERFAWLAQKITQLGALLFSRPTLAR